MYIKAKLKVGDSKILGQFIRSIFKNAKRINSFSAKNGEVTLDCILDVDNEELMDVITGYEIIEFSCESDITDKFDKNVNVNMEKDNLVEHITKLLSDLGIPANILGYEYIREAILISIDNIEYTKSITKMLYPEIAKRFKTQPLRVERAIRHAIELAWNNAEINFDDTMIGGTILAKKYKPTNGAFIATIADKFRVKLKKV